MDGVIQPVIDRHRDAKLAQIGFHRRRHIGVLQLAGDLPPIQQRRAMHLAEARGGGGHFPEMGEAPPPIGAEFGRHAAADEIPAHGGRIRLQLGKLGGVLVRQRVRHR